jgi:hypothetical protein
MELNLNISDAWTYEQVVYLLDDELDRQEVDYCVYSHKTYQNERRVLELEVQPDGGFCCYVRGDDEEVAFSTIEEAIDWWKLMESVGPDQRESEGSSACHEPASQQIEGKPDRE